MPPPGSPVPEPLPSAARERVVEVLTRHFANDALTEAELEARLQRVYAATAASDLDAVIEDLPALSTSVALPVPPGQATDARITALFSGQERRLAGVVPRALTLRARLGYVELDLTRARFEPGITTIDVRAFMGYVQIRLPAGVRVESAGQAVLGFFTLKDAASPDARSVVRVIGRAVLGFAEALIAPDRIK